MSKTRLERREVVVVGHGDDERLPYAPIYTDDFFGSARVQFLDGYQRGNYLLLLALQWAQKGRGLPTSAADLARATALSPKQWAHVAGVVEEFFVERDGRLFNEKLHEKWLEAKGWQTARVERARKAANARWNPSSNARGNADGNARVMPSHPHPHPHPDEEKKRVRDDQPDLAGETEASRKAEIVQVWNQIAGIHGLQKIRNMRGKRWQRFQDRLAEWAKDRAGTGTAKQTALHWFWEEIDGAIRKRSDWARQRAFPSFDQVVDPSIFTRLLEGNYDDRSPKQSWTDEELKDMP